MTGGLVNEFPRILAGVGAAGAESRERQALFEDIRTLRDLDISPVLTGDEGALERAGVIIAGSLPGLAGMYAVSPWALVGQFASDARQTIRRELESNGVAPEMAAEFSNGLALPAGVAMAALGRITFGMADSLPGVKQLQAKLLTTVSKSAVKTAAATAGAFGLETVEQAVQEGLQDSAPLFLTEIAEAMGAPVPDVAAWGPAMETLTDPAGWAVAAVFAGIGFGRMPEIDAAQILRERGASDDQIQAVIGAPDQTAYRDAVIAALGAPQGAPVGPVEADTAAAAAVDNAAAGVSSISRDAAGWWVEHEDGRRTRTDSAAAARMLVDDLAQVNAQDEADAFVELADSWATTDPRARVRFTGEQVTAGQAGVFTARPGERPRLLPMDPETAENLRQEIELLQRAEGGSAPMTRVVAGSNNLEYRRRVGDTARAVVETLATKQNVGGDVLTMIHERVEATWRAAIEEGTINMAETFRALRRVEAALGRAVMSEDPSETEVRETVSELVAADVLGRRKDGSRLPAGSVTKGLTAAINSSVDPAERATLGKFRAFLRAVRAFWRRVFQTAAALTKARREGKLKDGDEWGAFVDKLLGIDAQAAHEADVVGELEKSGEAFSLSTGAGLERLARQIENRPATPREKAKIFNRMAAELAGMARSINFSDDASEVIKRSEIHKRAKVLRVELLEKYELEAMEAGAGDALASADLATVMGRPFMAWLFDESKGRKLKSRLMSRTRAAREGKFDPDTDGDFDGARGMPRWVFNGNEMPDVAAREAYRAGLIPDETVDALWQKIGDELQDMQKWRQRVRAAEGKLIDARKRAFAEARQWEATEVAKSQANREATRDADAKRALVILDRMLATLPAEVRAKVGGFTAVGDMRSNDARFKYFGRKVVEIDKALEVHLRNQYLDELRELFNDARPKMAVGERDKGKIGVDGHAWLAEAERITRLSARELEIEEAAVEKALASPALTEETISHYRKLFTFATDEAGARIALEQHEALLNLFGAVYHRRDGGVDARGHTIPGPPLRNAGEIFAALEAAQNVVDTGRLDWFREIIARRERRAMLRGQAIADAGGPGSLDAVEGQAEDRRGMASKFRNYVESHLSFEGFLSSVFGENSATHKWADGGTLRADLAYRDSMRERERSLTGFLRTLWPRSNVRQRQRRLEQLATSREVPNAPAGVPRMSELDAVHFTMLWADEDTASKEWLEAWGLGEKTQAALEAWLSDDAKAIRQWLADGYDAQYDQINAVHRRMYGVNLPRVKNYAPRLVDHGGNANEMSLDPMQEGRQLMAGFTKRRRIDVKSPPRQVDALTAYWQNAHAVEYWKAWAEQTSDFKAVFSHYSTHAAVKSRWGGDTATALNEWLGILERKGIQNANGQGMLRRWTAAMADFALVGKLGVLAKQMVAGYASASQIGIGDFLKSVSRIARGEASITLREMYRSDAVQRRMSNLSPEARIATRGRGLTPIEGTLDKFLGLVGTDINALDNAHVWLRERIGAMDAVFTTLSAAAAYDAAYRDGRAAGLDDAGAKAAAMARTEFVVADSAQPEALRDKSLGEIRPGMYGRLLMPFQSANRQALAMTILAVKQGRTADAVRMAAIHWMVTGIVVQTVGNVMRSLLDDDDVEDIWEWEDYARSIVIGPLTGARWLGMGIEAVAPFFGGFERRQAAVPFAEGLRLLRQAIMGEWDFKALQETLGGVGLLVGGRATWAAIAANLLKQGAGVLDVLTWSEDEADAKQAKRDRETIREFEKKKPKAEKSDDQKKAEAAQRRAREKARAEEIRRQGGE